MHFYSEITNPNSYNSGSHVEALVQVTASPSQQSLHPCTSQTLSENWPNVIYVPRGYFSKHIVSTIITMKSSKVF